MCEQEQRNRHLNRPDVELLEEIVTQQNEDAFRVLVSRYRQRVYGMCFRILRNTHDAEDATQATFGILTRNAGEIRERKAVASWLCGVAYRESLKLLRQNQRWNTEELCEQHAYTSDDPLNKLAVRHRWRILDEELECLAAKYRDPIVMHYLGGMKLSQIADEMNLSLGVIQGRLRRGRKRLRLRLLQRGIAFGGFLALLGASRVEADAVSYDEPAAYPEWDACPNEPMATGGSYFHYVHSLFSTSVACLLLAFVSAGVLASLIALTFRDNPSSTELTLDPSADVSLETSEVIGQVVEIREQPSNREATISLTKGHSIAIAVVCEKKSAAAEYQQLLEENGFSVDLVEAIDLASTKLSSYSLIIVSGDLENGSFDLAKQEITEVNKPVLALGVQGYRFLGSLKLRIGAPKGMANHCSHVLVSDQLIRSKPDGGQLRLNADGSGVFCVEIGMSAVDPFLERGEITLIGGDAGEGLCTHYPIISQGKYTLWGFSAPAEQMSIHLGDLLVETCRYLTSGEPKGMERTPANLGHWD